MTTEELARPDTGDVVYHEPTGEEWTVAFVKEDRLAWCGWPPGEASLADCTLVKKVAPDVRLRILREMAASSDSRFVAAAIAALEAEAKP